MSCRRGGPTKGAPRHQNSVAFKHNKHSKKSKKIEGISHMGLCPKCQGIIEWRKKYRKYKPLKAPRKCGSCSKRAIVRAYHVICGPCRSAKQVCAKCLLPCNQWKSVGGGEEEEEEEEAGGAQADNNPNGNHVDTNESKPNDGIYEEEDKKGAVVDTETNEEKSVNPSSSKPQPTRKELNERLNDPDLRERERRTILRKLDQM